MSFSFISQKIQEHLLEETFSQTFELTFPLHIFNYGQNIAVFSDSSANSSTFASFLKCVICRGLFLQALYSG